MTGFKSAVLQNQSTVKHLETAPDQAPKPSGTLHFTISVGNVEEAVEFYTRVIGATFWRRATYSAFMSVGDDFFVLSDIGYHRRPNNPGHCLIHNAFLVQGENFDNAVNFVESQGIEFVRYETERHNSFSGRHAYFQDPWGNGIELIDLQDIGKEIAPPHPDFDKNRRRFNYFGKNQFEE
ncbi:MAG: VOC family protein [Rhodospirillaceae bacterium]